MRIRRERYFAVNCDDEPGVLSRVSASLMEAQVDCYGIWGFGTTPPRAEILVVPHEPERFKQAAKTAKWDYSEGICFHLEGRDKRGALVDILNRLAKDGVSLRAVDAIAVEGNFGCYIWVNEEDQEHVAQMLGLSTPKP